MTQRELADGTGMGRDAIARFEAGEREPRIMSLIPIAFALNVPILALLRGVPGTAAQPSSKRSLTVVS
jgi:transcriptional regulator with XRE-family HTH domain